MKIFEKKLLAFFLVLILLINLFLPLSQAKATSGVAIAGGIVSAGTALGCYLFGLATSGLGLVVCSAAKLGFVSFLGYFLAKNWGSEVLAFMGDKIVKGFVYVIAHLSELLFRLMFVINNNILAPLIDIVAQFHPFEKSEYYQSPAEILWNILVSFSYIVLVFSALFAGFQWLFGQDDLANRLIFNILIVALFVNFSFLLVKESYNIVDALEVGLSGGNSKQIGTIIAASLWQVDVIKEMEKFMFGGISQDSSSGQNDAVFFYRSLGSAVFYFFIFLLSLIIFIALIVVAALIIFRYFIIVILAGVSPLAFASLVIPEFKQGALAQAFANFKIWDKWLGYFVNWLLVVPIFVLMVILGNVIQKASFSQISNISSFGALFEFIFLLIFLLVWYYLAISFAKKMAKSAADKAAFLALGTLTLVGGAALGLVGGVTKGMTANRFVRKGMGKLGERVEKFATNRMTKANRLTRGFYSRVGLFGNKIKERVLEEQKKFYEEDPTMQFTKKILKEDLEVLSKTKDSNLIKETGKRIAENINRYKDNPLAFRALVEELGKMSRTAAENLTSDEETFKALLPLMSKDAPQESRQAMIDIINKLSSKTLTNLLTNPIMLEDLQKTSVDVFDAFLERTLKELKDNPGKVIKAIAGSKDIDRLIDIIKSDEKIKSIVDSITNNFFSALLVRDLEKMGIALAENKAKLLGTYESVEKLLSLQSITDDEKRQILSYAFRTDPDDVLAQLRRLPGTRVRDIFVEMYKEGKEYQRKETLSSEIQKLTSNLQERNKQLNEINNQIEEKKKNNEDFSDLSNQMSEIQKEIQKLQDQLNRLKDEEQKVANIQLSHLFRLTRFTKKQQDELEALSQS